MIIADIADFDSASVHVAQHHVGFAEAAEIAETHDLPFLADRAQEGGAGDEIIADVVNLEPTGTAVAQDHVGGVATEKAAEADKLPIGPDDAQLIGGEQRITADVVDFVLARHGGGSVRAAQDHVGGGAGGRRRVRRYREEEAVPVQSAIDIRSDDLAHIVDARRKGPFSG